jgi:hypothetical protein
MRERGGEASKQEVDNERRRFAPKDAFHAGPWGGTRPHVIGNAGAVRGRSTGGCTRRTRCHRDSRDATTVSAAYYSPSAPAHTPHRSTCAHRRTSSEAIAIRAGRAKQKGRGEHGFLVRECSSVRETKVYGITASEKSPPQGWDSRRAVERLTHARRPPD